jgi:hypothetical protein
MAAGLETGAVGAGLGAEDGGAGLEVGWAVAVIVEPGEPPQATTRTAIDITAIKLCFNAGYLRW